MQTVYIGNTLINDVMLGSQRMEDVISFNYDNNAINFLSATGLFDQQPVSNAINTLVTDLKGYDVYRQIGGKELATKVLFYKNKSKIIVETKKGDMIFEVRGDGVGRWYACKFNKLNYEITLGKKSPEEILIETFEGIRKDNSRLIFIILITIIIGDCLMDCFV